MDFDEKNRRQLIRVIIAEIGMVLSVIAIVVVSTMAAMGFVISSNGSIEQSGLMQLHTLPTGANVKIDGNTILARTNLSRTLSAGMHQLEIYRDGYDSWQNQIKIRSGALLRLYYPRLFLQNRVAENVKNLTTIDNLEFYSPSTKRNYILYAEKGSPEWQLVDVRGDEIRTTPLDLSGILPGMLEEKNPAIGKTTKPETHEFKFHGRIDEIKWSDDEEQVLVKVTYETKSEWVLVRLRDIARSMNLTRTFGLGDTQFSMIDSSATQLYALERKQLRRVNTNDGSMSRVLIDNVKTYQNKGSKIIYLSEASEGKQAVLGVFRDDERGSTILTEVPENVQVKIGISRYFDEDYLVYAFDKKVTILRGNLPSYREDNPKPNPDELKPLVDPIELAEIPDSLVISPDGEYVVAYKGQDFNAIDLDDGEKYSYEAPTNILQWFDASMMYAVKEKQILVWDFDGTNQRNLAQSAKTSSDQEVEVANSSVMVTANNRWIYYLTQGDKFTVLTREKIRD